MSNLASYLEYNLEKIIKTSLRRVNLYPTLEVVPP
jgi:hypothetical protein